MADEELPDLEEPARRVTRGVLKGIGDWLKGWLKSADAPDEPGRGVLILGAGGTGKTTFARLLSGDPLWLDDRPGDYVESTGLERFAQADDPEVEVVVAPGQQFRRPSTWPELLRQVAGGEYRGVVLVNSYGHHTFSTPSYKNHQLYAGSKDEFLNAYYADRRAEEVRILQHLAPHLQVCPRKVWLLSVVAKQDLWGSRQGDVEGHYRGGDYRAAIEGIARSLGDRSFRHEAAFVSLVIRNLETTARERLQTSEAGYDMPRLVDSLRTLVAVFAELKAWEASS